MWLAAGLFTFVLILGPTLFILNFFLDTTGAYLQNLVHLSFWSETWSGGKWQNGWTIFYWAWWISWTPFVGTFIARVSKGRTVREFIIAVIIVPTIVCSLWFGVFGGTGLYYDLVQGVDVAGQSLETALFYVFDQMPLSGVLSIISLFLIITYLLHKPIKPRY